VRQLGHPRARPVAQSVAGEQDLAHDLARRQVADKALRAGMAKGAGERTADLARYTERSAAGFGDVDRLDLGSAVAYAAARQPEQPLAGSIGGDLLGDDFRARNSETAFEFAPQRLCDIGHRAETARAMAVDPAPKLGGAHAELLFRNADGCKLCGELRAVQPDQRRQSDVSRMSIPAGNVASFCLRFGLGTLHLHHIIHGHSPSGPLVRQRPTYCWQAFSTSPSAALRPKSE
jgi:hypothetical protein